jgi:hypothetical protein
MINKIETSKYVTGFILIVYAYFCYLMFKLLMQYIPLNSDAGFLRIKQDVVTKVSFYLIFFYTHVYTSILVLPAGFTQFSSNILKKQTSVHKLMGRIYAYVVLLFAAPSGIIMGFFSNGTKFTSLSFIILGSLWFYFTFRGITAARNRSFHLHKKMMIRSFALALSAITLRSWKVIIVYSFHTAPMDTYNIISWLGWIPNLLIAEYIINRKP